MKDGYKGQAAINKALGEVVFSTPDNNEHDPDQYQFDRVIGRRRSNGQIKLKRLSAQHKNVIALHVRCLSNRDIAFITGLTDHHVGMILRDPLSQEIIGSYLGGIDQELSSLAPLAVDAVRAGLEAGDVKIRLHAADRFFKATGKYAKAEAGHETAEDVLARALARVASENASALREIVRVPPVRVIEGISSPVTEDSDD